MFAITVLVGNAGWSLLYKTREPWEAAIEGLRKRNGATLTLVDDFGQQLESAKIDGWMSEDMDESKNAHVERALHQMRMQNMAQLAAERDPSLRMLQRGPAMLAPHMMMPPPPNFDRR